MEDENEGKHPFPNTLYSLLESERYASLIHWSSATTFIIRDIDKFSAEVLPKLFGHPNFSSFVRLLNSYAFKRTKNNRSECEYRHPVFIRGRQDLLVHITRKNANFFKAYTNAAGEGAVLTPEKATMVAEAASAQSQVNLAPVIVNAASNTAHVVQAGAAANAMGAGAGVHPELLAQLASHMLVQGPGGYFHTQAAAAPASQHIQNNITGLLTQLAAEGPSHLPPHLQQQYQLLMQRGRPDPTAGLSADGSGSGPMTGNFFPHQIQSAPAMPSLGLGGFSSNLCGPMSAPANPMMFGMFSGGLQQQMQLQQSGMPLLQMPFLPMPMQMQMNTPPFMTGMQGQGQGQLFASMMGPPPMQGAHEYPGLLVSPAVLGQASAQRPPNPSGDATQQ